MSDPTGRVGVVLQGLRAARPVPTSRDPEPLQTRYEPLQEIYANRPDRLAAVFDYAEDRASYLDIRESVARAAGAYDAEPLAVELEARRADEIIAAFRSSTVRVLARQLEDPARRAGLAGALVAAVLP